MVFTANGDGTLADPETGSTRTGLGTANAGSLAGTKLLPAVQSEFRFAREVFNADADVYGWGGGLCPCAPAKLLFEARNQTMNLA